MPATVNLSEELHPKANITHRFLGRGKSLQGECSVVDPLRRLLLLECQRTGHQIYPRPPLGNEYQAQRPWVIYLPILMCVR